MCFLNGFWLLMIFFIAKFVLICVTLCCCKENPCPRKATYLLFFIFSGCEFIYIFALIAGRAYYATPYCIDYEDELNDLESLCMRRAILWLWFIIGILFILVIIHIFFGIGFYYWWKEAAKMRNIIPVPQAIIV